MKIVSRISALLIPILCGVAFIGTGYASWVFNDVTSQAGTYQDSSLTINSVVENGKVQILTPSIYGYKRYAITFSHGVGMDIYDERKGIEFAPAIRFRFYDYREYLTVVPNAQFYFHFTFSFPLDCPVFGDGGYAYFPTNLRGQSLETKIPFEVDTTDDVDETFIDFTPIFYYQQDMKPFNSVDYNALLTLITEYEALNKSVTLTVHITE